MKVHGNKEHLIKRIEDEALFEPVRLQSWFWEGKERYWVVDESQQQDRLARPASQAIVRNVGEELDNSESESD